MSTSLTTGVSGLVANQQMLDVVGNNLANSNTPGFKGQRVRFADLLYQTLKPATGSSSGSGTNPVQIGSGVDVAAVDTNQQQGNLESTGNDLDMAIQGNGYFVLNGGIGDVFSRAGAFGLDQNQHLADLATGFRVQRFGSMGEQSATSPGFQIPGDTSIRIPLGTGIPGKATSNISLKGNLSADAAGPLEQELTTSQPFLSGGSPATAATVMNNLDINTVDYVAGDQLRLQGSTAAGGAVDITIPVPATMNDLVTAINSAFPGSTATLDANGNLVLRADAPGPSSLQIGISDAVGDVGQSSWRNNSLIVTTAGRDGEILPTAIQFYDELGRSHSLNLSFQKQQDNVWSLKGSIPTSDGNSIDGVVSGITFNENGSFQQVSGTGIGDSFMTFQLNGLLTPQTVRLQLGSTNGFDGVTQFGGSSSSAAVGQDGYAAGSLTGVSIGGDGVISGIFTNGQTLGIAQLALGLFANPDGLTRSGQNYLTPSTQSGPALIGTASAGGRGQIQQRALEASNVEVSLEFTRLILAQRGFQVNARTISVSDQVLQELANLIH